MSIDIPEALRIEHEELHHFLVRAESESGEFAEKLLNHARLEEEVLYPAAIVVGDFLRMKLPRMRAAELRMGGR